MTTEDIKYVATDVGNIPSPSNWMNLNFADDDSRGLEPPVMFLEKAVNGKVAMNDISGALDEYTRLHKAGIASPAELLTLSRAYPDNTKYSKELKKMGISDDDNLVIGGPASIEMVDREGHLITTNALDKAFDKYMANFRTRNAMVLHSDVQVGWALPAYISKSGQIFKSGVNGDGLFFITELRNDTKIAKKVAEQIGSGKLKSYSIAGSALKTKNIQKGLQDVMQVDELELAEVTVCEKGVNQAASFDIIKSDEAATSTCIDGSCLVKEDKDDDEEHVQEKLDPEDVNYQKATDGQLEAGFNCGTCEFFNKEDESCSIVTGTIESDYWCSKHSENTHNGNGFQKGVELVMKGNNEIDFMKSFMNFMKKEDIDEMQFATLYNTQARQDEHHRLLDKYGFPSELEPENARYTPVIEEDPSPMGHKYVPWAVNEAGQNLGMRYYNEALTKPQLGKYTKRGVIEGGNSKETPASQLNTTEGFNNLLSFIAGKRMKASGTQSSGEIQISLSKSVDDLFNWMAQDAKHMYKSSCPCEMCFQKSSDYKGTIEKVADFLD
tara:strand:- start:311 stop:1969 length:1659 start_codon:yes stop_codon:yes gene_type:complete